jgi:peptidoglycan pentaglycine glycine transferase (the first glycine)
MNMKIIEDKSEWDRLIIDKKLSFLQSFEWGEFQRGVGYEPVRILFSSGSVAQFFRHRFSFFFSYLSGARVSVNHSDMIELIDYTRRGGDTFLRVESLVQMSMGAPVKNRQPVATIILDITRSVEDVLASMHTKTRYNIRLADRRGVDVRHEKDIDIFLKLNRETTKRDGFRSHSDDYYAQMLELPMVHQFNAYSDGEALASIICIGYGDTFTYLHGASSDRGRSAMPTYLLQWRAIEFARANGFAKYDFWGISPKVSGVEADMTHHGYTWDSDHTLSGITRFKSGFGGEYVEYPDAFELPVSEWRYGLFRFLKRVI